jgi:heat shock protein HslJ
MIPPTIDIEMGFQNRGNRLHAVAGCNEFTGRQIDEYRGDKLLRNSMAMQKGSQGETN